MNAKIFWFALNCFILNNYYLVTETSGEILEEIPGEYLERVWNKISRENQKALTLVQAENILRSRETSNVRKIASERPTKKIRERALEELNPNEVTFYLFTRENPNGENFTVETVHEIVLPEKKEGVKVICHGWGGDLHTDTIEKIRNAYLETVDVYVIGVDWNSKAGSYIYTKSARMTKPVGEVVARVIDALVLSNNVSYKKFHFIGHSLGAHVGAFAGRSTKELIGRITGLDPALPGFDFVEIAGGRLSRDDAHFVDVIHTCVHLLGTYFPSGKVDFYPNGGSPFQPGCSKFMSTDTMVCSHKRAIEYYAESVRNGSDFLAVKCDSWGDFTKGSCFNEYTQMGERVDPQATGIYYLQTHTVAPYYLGKSGTEYQESRT